MILYEYMLGKLKYIVNDDVYELILNIIYYFCIVWCFI